MWDGVGTGFVELGVWNGVFETGCVGRVVSDEVCCTGCVGRVCGTGCVGRGV